MRYKKYRVIIKFVLFVDRGLSVPSSKGFRNRKVECMKGREGWTAVVNGMRHFWIQVVL